MKTSLPKDPGDICGSPRCPLDDSNKCKEPCNKYMNQARYYDRIMDIKNGKIQLDCQIQKESIICPWCLVKMNIDDIKPGEIKCEICNNMFILEYELLVSTYPFEEPKYSEKEKS